MNIEELYRLVEAVPESKWAEVARYLKIKAMPTESPTDAEIEAIRQGYGKGEFYKYATPDELKAGFKKVNEMIMNRKEFNEVFEVTVSEERWVALKTYLRDLNQPENMPTAHEVEVLRLYELEKNSPDYVTYSHDELMECYSDDCEEVSVAKVIKEDLLQSIDDMSAEHLKLVSDYVMNLSEDEGSALDAKE
ncbi:hypothetical protein [Sporosarcina sp. HYO08]|uniref:hypothetical protein n=1 Tax=Sporosarcina sp. HYO08 TaxID=1759557 RepID=UPI000791CD76|nr:hypothetical protein [Sporosarcina sp. HYO08]KXH81850.1 hypothetical protein AU377_06190 [Sporosarcina sp. HYO08]